MLHLAENIKTVRELANKTQQEFAELFGIKSKKGSFSADKVFTYENGKANPPESLITNIAEFARVSVDDLKNKKLTKRDIDLGPDVFAFSEGDQQAYVFETKSMPSNNDYIKLLQRHIDATQKSNEIL